MVWLIKSPACLCILEHPISFQTSLGTAGTCSPFTCRGRRATGSFLPSAPFVARTSICPQEKARKPRAASGTGWIKLSRWFYIRAKHICGGSRLVQLLTERSLGGSCVGRQASQQQKPCRTLSIRPLLGENGFRSSSMPSWSCPKDLT